MQTLTNEWLFFPSRYSELGEADRGEARKSTRTTRSWGRRVGPERGPGAGGGGRGHTNPFTSGKLRTKGSVRAVTPARGQDGCEPSAGPGAAGMPLRDGGGGNPEPAGLGGGAGCTARGGEDGRGRHDTRHPDPVRPDAAERAGESEAGGSGASVGGAGGERGGLGGGGGGGMAARRDPPRSLAAMSGSAAAAGVFDSLAERSERSFMVIAVLHWPSG